LIQDEDLPEAPCYFSGKPGARILELATASLRGAKADHPLPTAFRPDLEQLLLLADEMTRRLARPRNQAIKARTYEEILKAIASVPLRLEVSGMTYLPWLAAARSAAWTVTTRTQNTPDASYNLYVILKMIRSADRLEPGLYIGMTSSTPEERFEQHASGIRAGRGLRQNAICLLPSFYSHLNPLNRSEAEELEPVLANALRRAAGPFAGRIQGPV